MKVYAPGASISSDYYNVCNNCEIDDGRPTLCWGDFALCLDCVRSLYVEHVAKIDKKSEKVKVKRSHISERLRNKLLKESGNRCHNCGCLDRSKLEIDHIVPFSLNGTTDKQNLRVLFRPCNSSKGNRIE